MYEVKQIEGKGLGIIAVKDISKGTLILKETPQMSHIDALTPNLQGSHEALKIWIKKVISLFNEMNLADQAEYMKLHSHFENVLFFMWWTTLKQLDEIWRTPFAFCG